MKAMERLSGRMYAEVPPDERAREGFREWLGESPSGLVRAPGRVNLIGEHTDYNEGFVLPMAIDRGVWVAFRPRRDERVVARSLDFGETVDFRLGALRNEGKGWAEYVRGCAWSLREAGLTLVGWEGVIAGNVPIGAGLSSSAALEMAIIRTFCQVSGLEWQPDSVAGIGRRAENDWVGVQCGIMDQLVAAAGKAGHALLIDCRSLHIRWLPLPEATAVVVLDTGTRRGLVDSGYNERRLQCQEASRSLGVRALRDITVEELNRRQADLHPVVWRRARHVVSEDARTLEAAKALERADAAGLGELMVASHVSLREDFEVSCPELNAMVDCACSHPSCYGARMTGAGFGGCAVALVKQEDTASFISHVEACYNAAMGKTPAIYLCQASNGAELIRL